MHPGEMTRRKREPTFTTDQERRLTEVAKKVFREQFKGKPKAQVSFGRALGKLSQSSVSALLNGTYVLGLKRAEYLAQLAGYDSLKDMIGPYLHDDDDADSSAELVTRSKFANLEKCIEYHGATEWKPWVLAAARAGYYGDEDFTPKEWEKRLNSLQSSKRS